MGEGLIYFKDGKLIAESGEVRAYKMDSQLFLEKGPGHNLWTLGTELADYIFQLGDKPAGDCLEVGLGLGIASSYILTFPKVQSLTTVEIDRDVIKVQKKVNPIKDDRHKIVNADGLYFAYLTKQTFDFIFLDFYSHIDEDTLPQIADMAMACKRLLRNDGKMIGWLDNSTPGNFAKTFFEIFNQ